MDKAEIKKVLEEYIEKHSRFISRAEVAKRYYQNKNDILQKRGESEENPLRNADNRIPRNFHGLLVNQKASYMFTEPPTFDTASSETNKKLTELLGDKLAKTCKDLCIEASNAGVAWLHFWKSSEGFKYAVVDATQIIPVWSDDLEKKLISAIRTYRKQIDEESCIVCEYWTDKECVSFFKRESQEESELIEYDMFVEVFSGIEQGRTNVLKHEFSEVPFVQFANNNLQSNDLENIKPLVDTYDKVFSGFVNDLEDIQEVIFVLSGYGGTDKATFVNEIKKYKMIDLQNEGADDKSGLTTLTIEIPVEAREKLLDMTRKAIFEQGQGVDPQPEAYGNASGVALKYLYSLLELKAGLMETEFRLGFGAFIRAICRYLGVECNQIIQTWTRTAITNNLELAEISQKSAGIISEFTILKNHPWVDNAEEEQKLLDSERKQVQDDSLSDFGKPSESDEQK